VRNNTISLTQNNTRYCLSFMGNNLVNAVSNNNNLHTGVSGGKVGRYFGDYTSLSDWQMAGGGVWDNASLSVDPNFINASVGNMEPQSTALNGAGTSTGLMYDFNRMPRNQNFPDIGSHEFKFPVSISSLSFLTEVCQGQSYQLTVNLINSSSVTRRDFGLAFSINTVLHATEVFTGTIAPGATASYTFITPIDANSTGTYTIEAW